MAGVTRGCLQYYFNTTEDILIALAQYVGRRNWEAYEAVALNPPEGRDLIEFAIDLVANPSADRYRVAHLELVTAARTMPVLRPVLEDSARQVEEQAKRFTSRLFGNAALADTPQFRAARDLTALVNDWLFVHIFPEQRDARVAKCWRPSDRPAHPVARPDPRPRSGNAQTACPRQGRPRAGTVSLSGCSEILFEVD